MSASILGVCLRSKLNLGSDTSLAYCLSSLDVLDRQHVVSRLLEYREQSMTLWVARHGCRMFAVLLAMLLVECAAYFFAVEIGVNRLYWVPVSFALVAYAGYDTVRRMPLIWGVVIGGVLAGGVSMGSLLIGSYLLERQLRLPAEVEPLLLVTTLLMSSLIGGIVGGSAGVVARARRRHRARRTAIGMLAYVATDEPESAQGDLLSSAAPRDLRTDRPLARAADGR